MPDALRPLSTLPILAALAAMPAGTAAADPLAPHRWRDRVVVALAPSPEDPRLAEQRRLFAALGTGGRERDLALVAAADGTPAGDALRRRFGGRGFVAVLVGKDGGEKLRSAEPLGRAALFPTIDAMPMRRDEMERQR